MTMGLWRGVIEEYRAYLPVTEATPVVTLKEGDTPLLEAKNLAQRLGNGLKLYLKFEGANPTGSFKDRGMTLAISKAVESGSKHVICASTGNTSASAAAYAAHAGLGCAVLLPHGSIAMGKLAQAVMHGAKVLAIEGNFDEALAITLKISNSHPVTMVNSNNPFRLEGQKTGAFEIIDVLGDVPEYQAIPVGNAGNITAYWKGYKEYRAKGKAKSLPKMCGFQAAGAAPIVEKRVIENPKTIATAIKIGNPYSWKFAEAARDESGGLIEAVTDDEILEAYRLLASLEGVFCEPASAASVAGVIKKNKQGYFMEGQRRIVCILTGHGLKDPDCAISQCPKPQVLKPDLGAILKALGL
jgi:threonine synthase